MCKGHTVAGNPCKKRAILGGTVCQTHGGGAPQVKAAAQRRLEDLIDPSRVLRELVAVAYFDLREIFDAKGNLRPASQWPDHVAAGIASSKIVKQNVTTGDGKVDTIHELKVWDKIAAITLLMRHLGMLTDKVEHSGPGGRPLSDVRQMSTEDLLGEVEALAARMRQKHRSPAT